MKLNKKFKIIFNIAFALIGSFSVYGQTTYNMQNNFVRDCEGILLDSDAGPEDGQYDHNEDYTFTICVDNAKEIVLKFEYFATEARYDVLTAYDGPDKNSPVIAILSGVLQPPPVIVATSGCLTLHFISDDNLVAIGWKASWSLELNDPEIPEITLDTAFLCPLPKGLFTLDIPISCDNFVVGNFDIVGPGGSKIIAVNPLDCDPVTGLAKRFEVIFDMPLDKPGTYRLIFKGNIMDACGELHDIGSTVVFELSNCPIEVEIQLVESACAGDCGTVEAIIIGRSSSEYEYDWSNSTRDTQLIEVCTEDSVLISVTITDPITGQTANAQYWYKALEIPTILNPLSLDTVCASTRDYFYQVSLTGGDFYSRIIPNNQRKTGRYQFWRWSRTLGVNEDIVQYISPNGCEVFDTVYVLPINAGSIQASCLNANSFKMNGGIPVGGKWTGPHVSEDGTFDPKVSGSFVVIYEAPNGCKANKRVNVEDELVMPVFDTICSAQTVFLQATPYGGRWSGPGIVNVVNGGLQAWRPKPNQSYTYVYTLNGCTDSLEIYIKALNAGPDLAICVEDSLFYPTIIGDWQGPGTFDSTSNSFDVSQLAVGRYTYTLNQNGCSDAIFLYIIEPSVEVFDTLEFCLIDQWFPILDYANFSPGWGSFSGAGIKDSAKVWYFNPMLFGPGRHLIEFGAVGCKDSFWIDVESPADIPNYSFCKLDQAVILSATPSGGTWSGTGFLDANAGLFDPQLLNVGMHEVRYTSPRGCITIDSIEIFDFEQVSITNVDQQYCYSDTQVNIILNPPGGIFYINGVISNPTFNPLLLGEGNHELKYSRGTGACASSDKKFISVLPPILANAMVNNDSICTGENAVIDVVSSGGSGILSAQWDNGLGFGNNHIVQPDRTTLYHVIITDGCSVPYSDSVQVFVHPTFGIDLEEGPPVCFEDTTYVRVIPPNTTDYNVRWQTNPPVDQATLRNKPGNYSIVVTERISGCSQEFNINLPGTPPITANFSLIPNGTCIDNINNNLELIDLATGYTKGTIDFGDGTSLEDLVNGSLSHDYFQIGNFRITQYIENDLGCSDSISQFICVKNKVAIYIPTAFTPNGDESNDVFKINAFGVVDVYWSIYSRTGSMVFESRSFDEGWDGTFKGKEMNPAVFAVRIEYHDRETNEQEVVWQTVTLVR